MKKIFIALAACALLAAGCEVKREGYQFVITTQSQETIIEGQQANWNLQSTISAPLMISSPGLQPMAGLVLPK